MSVTSTTKELSVKIFAKNLRNIREQKKLSREFVARQVGITEKSIYNYEHALTFPKSSKTIEKLAKVLDVERSKLLV